MDTSTNKAGAGGSAPATRPAHIVIPPRTLPSQLEESSPLLFDGRSVPFSPTSPGKRSPGRPRTMKEYEEDLVNLKKENFNLKVRIYFMEQSRFDSNLPKDIDELRNSFTDLKVEYELTKKDLASKEDLLLNTYRALDAQKQQLESHEAMKAEYEAEKLQLQNKIESLEKDLKEYHLKFMETSVQLDDTNAMYAITFGLNKKTESKEEKNHMEEKVKELENELAKEKERVLMLEEMVVGYNEKSASDQKYLVQLREEMIAAEEKLVKAMKEKDVFEQTVKEIAYQRAKLEKTIYKKDHALKQKEGEIQAMKTITNELEVELAAMKCRLQEKVERAIQSQSQSLLLENSKLKQEVKFLQQQVESRSTPRALRERSSSSRRSGEEREQSKRLREAQARVEELQKEVDDFKNNKSRYHHSSVEGLIQTLLKENKILKKELDELKSQICRPCGNRTDSTKEEIERNIEELKKEMTTEKDITISELKQKIEELTSVVNEKECRLQEYKSKSDQSKAEDIKVLEDNVCKLEREKDLLTRELDEQNREVVNLKKELKKRTYNLQGLVNTELWDKNREIEKLNKVCERQHLEVLSLQKQLREFQLTLVQQKVTSFVSGGCFVEDKENLQPITDPMSQVQKLSEENRLLTCKVEELQARLLNTPERDTESLLVQTLRAERDQADKLRKDAVNACMLLTTRLQELADFLDSLLPSLCGKKRKVVQQAVERSRELSKSLSIAAEESTLHCSAWTDLQPSLYIPLLPDISTVDFWSGDECEEETFSGGEEVARLKSQVETLTEEVKQKDGEIARFQSEKNLSDNFLMKSVFEFNEKNFLNTVENNRLLGDSTFGEYIADVTEGSLVDTCSDQNIVDRSQATEVKSANIGKITLTSKKKEPNVSHTLVTFEETKQKEKDGSEYETWSEPDRDVSYARMGLKEDAASVHKSSQNFDDTSGTADSTARSPSSRRASEIQRLQRKIRSLEQVNEALRSELMILHQLAPPALSRQDKATSIELSRQSLLSVPSHLLEEIRNQREKLEASLFHNDYIRRQLESTVSSLRKSQGDDQEKALLLRLKEVTSQLELAESELSKLKVEKDQFNRKMEMMQTTLQQNANELNEKQRCFSELEHKTAQNLKEVEEKYSRKCVQAEEKCLEMEQKWFELQKEKDLLLERISNSNQKINKLTAEIENYEQEGKKDKQLQEDLNVQIKQICQQKDELQRLVAEQEQLLADAERERQELATQLIARDRQVSELQKRLTNVELSSSQLEAALRSQLDLATHQCAQFEAKIRELDCCSKQVAQVERIKVELERRVVELEAANAELETRLASLNIIKPSYSDCETDTGSSIVGSPRRTCPPPLPRSPPHLSSQRSNDLTSDYLSDQDAALSSPQTQPHNLWFPTSPQSHTSASPDLGIDSDHGRFSSLETNVNKPTAVSLRGIPAKDLMKLEEENTQLRRNLQKTRHALEETLSQLTAANQHKRQYEAQLTAAKQHTGKVERAISRQLYKTHSILKKARVNLEEDGKSEHH